MDPVFIGDEVTGVAYRLAGCDVRVTAPAESPVSFRRALEEEPPVILITSECASALPADELDAALALCNPPVVVVPDAAARAPMPDYTTVVRSTLGIAG